MQNKLGTDLLIRLVFVFCLFAVIAAAVLTVNMYQKNQENEIQILKNKGRDLVAVLDHELDIQGVTLEIIGAEARSILDGQKYIIRGTIVDLVPTTNPQGFTLTLPRGRNEEQVGNLTGLGMIPSAATPRAMEIAMALGLLPLFEQVIRNNDAIPWVYYTSASRFIYAFPRVSPEDFFYSDILLKTEFFTIATPENNPDRKLVWSAPYEDTTGAGLMVTASMPIYDKEQFLGVLSIDLGISRLQQLMQGSDIENAAAYLVGPDGKTIAGVPNIDKSYDIPSITTEDQVLVGESSLMIFPLKKIGWYIVLEIDRSAFFLTVLNKTATAGMVFLFVVFSVALILLITYYMRSARYMAIHDNLTGVLNRRAFDEMALSTLQKNASPELLMGLAIVDIDFFKKYNDRYGHVAGDETLRRVANSLVNSMRSSQDRIYRVGGEEFVILLLVKTPEDMMQILARLIDEVNDLGIPHEISPFNRITVSAGGVISRFTNRKDLEDAYSKADRILYQAKETGRNRWMMA